VSIVPSGLISLAGKPSAASQEGADWPLMTEAVLATLASTQLAAATETAAQ
jgi:hypothetical protein